MLPNNQQITTLHNLLDYDAGKFVSAEIELQKSLEHWISKASSLKLKAVLQRYLDFVNRQLQSMEEFFEKEDEIISMSITNKIMLAFIEDTDEKLSLCTDAEVKDACILAGVQAINHFKISTYGTAAAFADAIGMDEFATVFYEVEVKEKQIDSRLSQLANYEINAKAATPISLPG